MTRIVSRTEEVGRAPVRHDPIERRTIPNGHRATDNIDVGAVRRGARLAGRGWLGQGFQQGPDLPVGVASVAAQGAEEGQPALLRPAADRLWGHMKKFGDLRGAQVPGLGWLGQRALPFLLSSPVGGTTLRLSGSDAIEGSTQAGYLSMHPGAAWLPAGVIHGR
jgi:hypothetical protein